MVPGPPGPPSLPPPWTGWLPWHLPRLGEEGSEEAEEGHPICCRAWCTLVSLEPQGVQGLALEAMAEEPHTAIQILDKATTGNSHRIVRAGKLHLPIWLPFVENEHLAPHCAFVFLGPLRWFSTLGVC